MNHRKLIGLVGYAGAGKDAAAAGLVAKGWERVAFADPLREMALAIDPMIPCHASASSHLSGYVAAVGWHNAKQHPEVRRLLQAIGTEAVRNVIGQDTWVNLARKKICDSTRSIVVTDVRFENEAAMIRRFGGVLVRIVREGVGPINGHASDVASSTIDCHLQVTNNGTIEDLQCLLGSIANKSPFADGINQSERATSRSY
jgi:hypothetical protein